MAEKETIILDFQIEQGDAISELEKTKKSIIQLKQEQQELNKAYKSGNVTLDEYAAEQVRLEGILKKQQNAYNNVQKSVTGVKTQFDKLIETNKGIQGSLQKTSGSLAALVPGFGQAASGVQTVTTASKALIATPLGAVLAAIAGAIAIVVAGLKKSEPVLDFFENIIVKSGAALDVFLSNLDKVASILGNVLTGNFRGAVDGFNDLTDSISSAVTQAELYLEASRELEDAQFRFRLATADASNQIKALVIQAKNRNLTFEQQEELLNKALTLEKDLVKQREDLARREAVIGIKQIALKKDVRQSENETFDQFVKNIVNSGKFSEEENDKIVSLYEGQKQAASESLSFQEKVANQLAAIGEKREAQQQKQNEALAEEIRLKANLEQVNARLEEQSLTEINTILPLKIKGTIDAQKAIEAKIKAGEAESKERQKNAQVEQLLQAQKISAIQSTVRLGTQLIDEATVAGKIASTAQATIDTYAAANLALKSLPPPFGAISAALNIALGLANVAKISGVKVGGAAAGGGNFMTKGPTLLMVGDNPGGVERVSVEPISGRGKTTVNGNLVKMAGGGVLETQSMTGPINQAFSFKSQQTQPIVYASWLEATELNNRIQFKEALVTV